MHPTGRTDVFSACVLSLRPRHPHGSLVLVLLAWLPRSHACSHIVCVGGRANFNLDPLILAQSQPRKCSHNARWHTHENTLNQITLRKTGRQITERMLDDYASEHCWSTCQAGREIRRQQFGTKLAQTVPHGLRASPRMLMQTFSRWQIFVVMPRAHAPCNMHRRACRTTKATTTRRILHRIARPSCSWGAQLGNRRS